VTIAFCGLLVPLWFSILVSKLLPVGLVALLLSLVPMFTFALALPLKSERFALGWVTGLGFGLASALLIISPRASLPDKALVIIVPIALVAPFFYALQGNLVER